MKPKYQVCDRCHGEGTVVNPVTSVWTYEDRLADPDGFDSMMRGDFDVTCPQCDGLRVMTAQDQIDHAERREEMRTMAMESGDFELWNIANVY